MAVLITAIGVSAICCRMWHFDLWCQCEGIYLCSICSGAEAADGQINITGETIVTIVSCLIIMAGLMLFINKTKAGQAMLAVSRG